MAYLDPDIAAFQAAGEMNLRKQQLEQQRLAQLAETARYDDQLAFKQKMYEEEKRQAEKEAYAKWEKEQILNQVASEMFQNRKGEFSGVTDSKGKEVYRETPLSQAETYLAAAKEAARRGKGGVAQEFMMQGQKIAQAEAKAKAEAQETAIKTQKTLEETRKLRIENEAASRDSGIELVDLKRAEDIFQDYTKDSKKLLDEVKVAKDLAGQVKAGNPDADVQLNTLLASLYQGSRLSNEDIRRVSQSGSLPTRVLSSLSKWTTGTPIDLSVDQKVELINSLEKLNADKYNQSVDKAVGLFQKSKGVPEDVISDYSGRKYALPEATKTTGNAPVQALDYLKANPNTKDAFKAKYGFIPEGY
jgi:hypothetical protein